MPLNCKLRDGYDGKVYVMFFLPQFKTKQIAGVKV